MTELERLKSKIKLDLSHYDIVDFYEYEKDGLFRKALKIRYSESGSKRFMFLYWDGEGYSSERYLKEVKKLEKPEIPLLYYENYNALCQAQEVFMVEGEKDVRNLYRIGIIAVTLRSGSDRIRPENLSEVEILKNKKIYLIGDNDQTGRDYLANIAQVLAENKISDSIKLGEIDKLWPQAPEKGDISDFLAAHKVSSTLQKEAILDYFKEVEPYNPTKSSSFSVRTANQILQMDLPERSWLVEGLLKDLGLIQLGGDSKLGKSLFAQQLSCAVASRADTFLNRKVKHGRVVYIDFENADPIKQQRFKSFLRENDPYNDRLLVVSVNHGQEIPRLDNSFIEQLDSILKSINYEVVLVVIDTWTHIRSDAKGDVNLHDREESMKLFRYCEEVKIPFLLLTHTLKNTIGVNKFNSFIGSTGIQGTMDTQMLISENKSEDCWNSKECILSIRGREIEEQEFVIFQADGSWHLKGGLRKIMQRRQIRKLLEDPITQALKKLVEEDETFEGTTGEFTKRSQELGITLNQSQKAITLFIRKNAAKICPVINCEYSEINSYKSSSHQTFRFRIKRNQTDFSHLKIVEKEVKDI